MNQVATNRKIALDDDFLQNLWPYPKIILINFLNKNLRKSAKAIK